MAYYLATYACPSSTGDFTMSSLPFTPTHAKFTTGGKISYANGEARHGVGWTDGTNQYVTSILVNTHGAFSRDYSDKCLNILSTPGGVIGSEVLASFGSFGTNQCTINFSATSNTYAFVAEFWDD